ncbi:MAG: hypothetical protein WAU07_05325 [Microgenomates group bacterium]
MIQAENPLLTNPKQVQATEEPLEEVEVRVIETAQTFKKYWNKLAVVLLGAHSVFGVYETIAFLFIEYPELDQQLKAHLIDSETVAHLTSLAIVLMVTTFINLFMAFRLHSMREEVATTLELLFATAIIVGTALLRDSGGSEYFVTILEKFLLFFS